ncbi:uncharacterized protein LOC123705629 [Colias croceus]|uniref:uncharacterized protein LOC123705629 n=1 Tax=Colias crocea TaxID=72248 RepID=UPI001E27FE6A|nr:uncharacterized protein LOC123705629 [Colias croceus]
MGLTNLNDLYNSAETLPPWLNQDTMRFAMQTTLEDHKTIRRRWSSGFEGNAGSNIDAVMQEFRMNGSDTPYDPEDVHNIVDPSLQDAGLLGLGPPSSYLRQKSWPAPDSTPCTRLPRYTPMPDYIIGSSDEESLSSETLTEQQRQVLSTIPTAVLYHLLRDLEKTRVQEKMKKTEIECRFCRNNGEREQYYRTHWLRVEGRVTCPVLRALVCRQCGAHGDRAHTLKYCPLTSPAQRKKSAAMMQSLRLASSRRRNKLPSDDNAGDYVVFGEFSQNLLRDGALCNPYEFPLDPMWAALEKKLMR